MARSSKTHPSATPGRSTITRSLAHGRALVQRQANFESGWPDKLTASVAKVPEYTEWPSAIRRSGAAMARISQTCPSATPGSWEEYDHIVPPREARGSARKPDSGSELYVHSWLAGRGG